MAARFWVAGGTGNWSSTTNWSATTGGASGASVPGSADTATFNASSGAGTATVDSSVTIQTLTMTGFTGTLAFGTNTISLNSTGTVFTGATTHSVSGTPVINVTSTGSTGITVIPGAATEANSISFKFTAGTYTLTFLATNGNTARNVDFTGFAGTWAARTGSSNTIYGSLTISSGMTFAAYASGAQLTFGATSGTKIITCSGKTIDFPININAIGGTYQFADAFSARSFVLYNGSLDGNNKSFTASNSAFSVGDGSFTTTTIPLSNISIASGVNSTLYYGTITLSGTLSFGGNFSISNPAPSGSVTLLAPVSVATSASISAGTLNLGSYKLSCLSFGASGATARTINFGTGDITCTGAGASWDATDVTNLTISGTPVVNFNNSTATASTITTGSLSEANSISFNINAGTYALTITTSAVFRNLNFTGFAGSLVGGNSATIYGDFTMSSGITVSTTSSWTLASTSATPRTITSNSVTIGRPLIFNGVGGTWQLQDALTMNTARALTHTNGTIDLNGKTLTVGTRYTTATGTKNLTFNAGTLVCPAANTTSFNNAAPTGFTTTAGTGTGKISMTAATAKTFVGGGSTYNCTLSNDGAGALTISGSNTFTTIANGVQPTAFTFTAATTQTVTNWNVSGTAGNRVTIISSTAGVPALLSKASGTVSSNYLSLKDSTATGGATWYAGANSTNVSGNSGWIFSNAPSNAAGSFFFMF